MKKKHTQFSVKFISPTKHVDFILENVADYKKFYAHNHKSKFRLNFEELEKFLKENNIVYTIVHKV